MKGVILAIVILTISLPSISCGPGDGTAKMTEGFFHGFFGETGAKKISECVNAEGFGAHVQNAITSFQEMSVESFKEGVQELLLAVHFLSPNIDACVTDNATAAEIKKRLIKIQHQNPDELTQILIENTVTYGNTVVKEINNAGQALKLHDYQTSGYHVGVVTELLIVESMGRFDAARDKNNTIEGWLIGFFDQWFAREALPCIDREDFYSSIKQSYMSLKSKDYAGSVKAMRSVFVNIKKSIDDCVDKEYRAYFIERSTLFINVAESSAKLNKQIEFELAHHQKFVEFAIARIDDQIEDEDWYNSAFWHGNLTETLALGLEGRDSDDQEKAHIEECSESFDNWMADFYISTIYKMSGEDDESEQWLAKADKEGQWYQNNCYDKMTDNSVNMTCLVELFTEAEKDIEEAMKQYAEDRDYSALVSSLVSAAKKAQGKANECVGSALQISDELVAELEDLLWSFSTEIQNFEKHTVRCIKDVLTKLLGDLARTVKDYKTKHMAKLVKDVAVLLKDAAVTAKDCLMSQNLQAAKFLY